VTKFISFSLYKLPEVTATTTISEVPKQAASVLFHNQTSNNENHLPQKNSKTPRKRRHSCMPQYAHRIRNKARAHRNRYANRYRTRPPMRYGLGFSGRRNPETVRLKKSDYKKITTNRLTAQPSHHVQNNVSPLTYGFNKHGASVFGGTQRTRIDEPRIVESEKFG